MAIGALDVAFVGSLAAVVAAVASPATALLGGALERSDSRKTRFFELRGTAYTDALRESIRMMMFFDRAFPERPSRTPSVPPPLPEDELFTIDARISAFGTKNVHQHMTKLREAFETSHEITLRIRDDLDAGNAIKAPDREALKASCLVNEACFEELCEAIRKELDEL